MAAETIANVLPFRKLNPFETTSIAIGLRTVLTELAGNFPVDALRHVLGSVAHASMVLMFFLGRPAQFGGHCAGRGASRAAIPDLSATVSRSCVTERVGACRRRASSAPGEGHFPGLAAHSLPFRSSYRICPVTAAFSPSCSAAVDLTPTSTSHGPWARRSRSGRPLFITV